MKRKTTLDQLEGTESPAPTIPSYLVQTIHALRQKPLSEFSVEDLRIMIGQQLGLQHLVPMALDHLERDPFVAGDFYKGDLLNVVAELSSAYWLTHPADARRMSEIADQAKRKLMKRTVGDIRARLDELLDAQPWTHAAR